MKFLPSFLFSLVLLFSPMVGAEDNAPLKIGVIAGYSGAAKEWADFGRMAIELARDEINKSGGVNGQPIKLLFEDSQTIPAKAVSAYTKLVTIDHVDAVIGELWAFLTNPLIPLSARFKVPTISPTVMDKSISETSPYFFSLGHRYVSLEGAVREFFDLHPKLQRVGILCWDDPWGRANLAVWKKILAERNIAITDELCSSDFSNDFRVEAARISKNLPDAVIVTFSLDVALKRFAEAKIDLPILTTSDIQRLMITEPELKPLLEGIYFTDWPARDSFVEQFEEKFNLSPILEAQNHYYALHALARAAQKNPKNILEGLKEVSFPEKAIDFGRGAIANHGEAKLLQMREGKGELTEKG